MIFPVGMPMALPPGLEPVRAAARRAISPIKPADSTTEPEWRFLLTATRTEAGENLPPYYLVYFLLVDLLGFWNLGRFEKLAWWLPIDFEGVAYLIDHRKSGVGVFARSGDEWEKQARRIVGLIHTGVEAAQPFFRWVAESAVQGSNLNVRNLGIKLFRRYTFFRDTFRSASSESRELRRSHEEERRQRGFIFNSYSTKFLKEADWLKLYKFFSYPWVRKSEDASWLALAAIEAFFGWTEHIFIHIAILQGKVTTGVEVVKLAEVDWSKKFKRSFDMTDNVTKRHFDALLTLRRQLRNFVAHGAFGKESEAFSFHSKAGAVPVALEHKSPRPRFLRTPELIFDDAEAITTVEEFICFIWSGPREPAEIYIQNTELPLMLPYAADGTYRDAM